jgi:hypothetical protein
VATLRPLPVEKLKGGRRDFQRVKGLEKRLEKNDLPGRNTSHQNGTELLTHSVFTILCSALRPVKDDRYQPSTSELTKRRNFRGLRENHYFNGFRQRRGL